MLIYHLQIRVRSDRSACRDKFHSQVFATYADALKDGKAKVAEYVQSIYEGSDYCTKTGHENLEIFIRDNHLRVQFIIIEVDPVHADQFLPLDYEDEPMDISSYEDITLVQKIMEFDRFGELECTLLEYYVNGSGYVISQYPGDDLPDAGTKFNLGDIVTVGDRGIVYVVRKLPLKTEKAYFENSYLLVHIVDGFFLAQGNYPEFQIKKCERELSADHPILMLSRLYRGDLLCSQETFEKIENSELALVDRPSWREIAELRQQI